jgi:hypothetical protein
VMRHDQAGSQFTRGQHLDRISLLAGLDDPKHQLQQVDILVPDGIWQTAAGAAPAQPRITPTLDWVLFRRRSDVDCGPPPQQLDTVTLYAVKANNEDDAQAFWDALPTTKGQTMPWTKVGDLQFDAGATSLVTPGATVQGWWSAAGIGTHLYGAAYGPAAASDQVALGRASDLVTALAPTVSGQSVAPVTLTAPPKPLETGTVGALFAIAWTAAS